MGDADEQGLPGPKTPPPEGAGSASRTVAVNAISNWGAMGVDFIVRLFLLKYLFDHLGREDYGVYLVSLSVTVMTGFLRFGMAGAVLRLASEGIAARDWQRLTDVLSVARTVLAIAAVLAFAGAVALSLFMLDVLKVPEASKGQAAVLIQLTGFSAACCMVSIVYLGTLRAAQRYYLSNAVLVGEQVIRAGMIVAFFSQGHVGLEPVGLCFAVPALMTTLISAALVRWTLPQVKISFRRFNVGRLREILGYSVWVAIVTTVQTVHNQMGAPLVSATIGPGAVPMLGVPRQMAAQIMRVVTGFTQPIRPMATTLAVRGQRERLARVYRISLRFTGVLIVPAVAALLAYGKPVIRFLTDAQMAMDSYPILVVYISLFSINILANPGVNIVMGVGAIRGLALSRAAALALGVVLGLAVAMGTGWGIIGLVAALNGPMLLHSLFYVSYRVQQETGVTIAKTMVQCLVPPILIAVVPVFAGVVLQRFWPPSNLIVVFLQMGICALAYLAVAWFVVLIPDEKQLLLRLLPRWGRMKKKGRAADRKEPPEDPPHDVEGPGPA